MMLATRFCLLIALLGCSAALHGCDYDAELASVGDAGSGTEPNPETPKAPADTSCNADTCAGCCRDNRCEPGVSAQACGAGGAACVSCTGEEACLEGGTCGVLEVQEEEKKPSGPKRIFLTRTRYDGNLKAAGNGKDGLDGADKLCERAAVSVQLGGVWKAWLSSSTVNAIDRIEDVGPWFNLGGKLVFNNKTNFLVGPINPIFYNERQEQAPGRDVWTGTRASGSVWKLNPANGQGAFATCEDWTGAFEPSTSGPTVYRWGSIGFNGSNSMEWTEYGSPLTCYQKAHLICIEQ